VNADGNLTAHGGNTLTDHQANRLTAVVIGATTSRHTDDGDGKRASRTVGAASPLTDTDDVNGALPVVLDEGTRKYVHGRGLAYPVDDTITATVRALHPDGLGSVRALTDSAGSVVQAFATDEFGVPSLIQGTSPELFRFSDEQRDAESGFSDLQARSYLPTLGRFVSRDTFFGSKASPLTLIGTATWRITR
jgi:RHS repeat-associated protein